MFPDQAQAVLDLAKPKLEEAGRITWGRPASEYPDVMYAAMGLILDRVAVEWIEENAPQAWFKPMFDGTAPRL